MLFGRYAPVPHVTAGSDLVRRCIDGALSGLPDGQFGAQMEVARDVLLLADEAGFAIALFAEHRGPDLEAWALAASIASRRRPAAPSHKPIARSGMMRDYPLK